MNHRMTRRTLIGRAAGLAALAAAAPLAHPAVVAHAGAETVDATPGVTGSAGSPEEMLRAWLDAFNSGDVDRIRAFHRGAGAANDLEMVTAFDLMTRQTLGALDLQRLWSPSPSEAKALVFATLSEEWLDVAMQVSPFRLGLLPAPPPTGEAESPLAGDALRAEIDRYVRKLADADAFSGALLVSVAGEAVYEGAVGFADRATGQPNWVDTKFNLGSMNKMFTAVAIAQLVERGELAFDDRLVDVVPDYPNAEAARQITLHHLLTHTSGLGDIFVPAFFADVDRYVAPRDYFPLFADEPLTFPPGERHEYSNAGFIVLGAAIEATTGRDYDDYVRQEIFARAGMVDTGAFARDASVPNLATGYGYVLPDDPTKLTAAMVTGPRPDNRATLPFKGSPAGGGYSSVGDLRRFHTALWGHALLKPAMTDLITTGKVDVPFGPGWRYGYGFIEETVGATRIVGHGGGAPGISANLDMLPARDVAVAVLANYDGVAVTVARRMRRMLLGDERGP